MWGWVPEKTASNAAVVEEEEEEMSGPPRAMEEEEEEDEELGEEEEEGDEYDYDHGNDSGAGEEEEPTLSIRHTHNLYSAPHPLCHGSCRTAHGPAVFTEDHQSIPVRFANAK